MSPAMLLGTSAGIPKSSKAKISAFPVLSELTDTEQYWSGDRKLIFVLSARRISNSPSMYFSPESIT